jgi:hypothetical protein
MVGYTEFSVVAADGAHIRIRKTLPDEPAVTAPPTFVVVSVDEAGSPVEALGDGAYRVKGKVYTAVRED